MADIDKGTSHMCYLPTEILLHIFTYLPAKQLTKCRQVCYRWKNIVDGLTRSDILWREYCKNDYTDIYKVARQKSRPGLLWYNIYKSLTLWPKFNFAREIKDEFASASNVNEEIRDFSILKDGIIGVHKRQAIVYYDIETLEQSSQGTINGSYMYYSENDNVKVILNFTAQLYILGKSQNPQFNTNVRFNNIKTFILVDEAVYYVNLDNEIYVFRSEADRKVNIILSRIQENVILLGYTKNHLTVLTIERNIYTFIGQDLTYSCSLGTHYNILQRLREYNLLEKLDWRVYINWLYISNHTIPQGPLRDITIIRNYGDIIFVGSNYGVLRIYHSPYSSGQLDLSNIEPIKQYNFMERQDCPVLSMCPIIQIDILEAEDGHTVLVAMPKKIVILDFVHSFKRTSADAMLPYRDIQKVKILRIDDGT